MNWTSYLLQVNIYLILFLAFYGLLLKNETFFQLNRVYLVGSAFFSVLIPLFKTEWVQSLIFTEKVQQSWTSVNIIMMEGFASPVKEETGWTLGDYLTLIYFLVVAFLIIRLVFRLIKITRLLKSGDTDEAFSFFRKIRINKALPQRQIIKKHEQAHARELHSADVLFFEMLSIINWFNPAVYLYKKAVKHIHEFIADEQALKDHQDKREYALLLFSKSFGVSPNSLTNTFFNQSILKKRIMMMNKPKSKRAAILKYGLSVPLFLLAMILSSAKISESETIDQIAETVKPKQEIVQILMPDVVKHMAVPTKQELKAENSSNQNAAALDSAGFQALKKFLMRNLRYPQRKEQRGKLQKWQFHLM